MRSQALPYSAKDDVFWTSRSGARGTSEYEKHSPRPSTRQCSQIVDGIHPPPPPPIYQFIAKKQFFTYNLGKFLKYITFSSCSLIIFESLPKLYLKTCFFQLNVKMEGVSSIHDLGALVRAWL